MIPPPCGDAAVAGSCLERVTEELKDAIQSQSRSAFRRCCAGGGVESSRTWRSVDGL